MADFPRFGHFPKAIAAHFPWRRVTAKATDSVQPGVGETYIKNSNVEIIIANGQPRSGEGAGKETDYLSLGIIVAVILAIGVYALMIKYGRAHFFHLF